jgi:hypothetical protein
VRRARRRRRHHRALSLTETAAAIVFVAVLAMFLLPASGAARGASKRSQCLSNLMRIGYANAIYAAQDVVDMALPVHPAQFTQETTDPQYLGPYEWGGRSGVGEQTTPGEPSTSRFGTSAGFGPATRPLNRILYHQTFPDHANDPADGFANWIADAKLDLDVHECPADTGYTGIHKPAFRDEKRTSYDHFGTSYAANIFMIADAGRGELRSNSPYLHRMSDIINPVRTLAYQENNGRFAFTAQREIPECLWIGQGIPGTVRGWHGKNWVFNAAFIDGHADAIYMRGYENAQVLEDIYLQNSLRCVTIRGENWQKDTLPLGDVPTGVHWRKDGRPSYEGGIE